MKNIKKKMTYMFSILILLCFVAYLYLMNCVPYQQIDQLTKGYVQIHLNGNLKPTYRITSTKPASWLTLNHISPFLQNAIITSEDWAFYQHNGIDLSQIKKAINSKLHSGKKLRGASTITQQLAKNLFFSNKRSLWRKIKEYFTVKYLEKKLGKKKILESYLNIIEYGKNTYGIKNASKLYFKKRAVDLNAKEGAFIAMILPNPIKYSQSFRNKKLTHYGKKTVNDILIKMKQAKHITHKQLGIEQKRRLDWGIKKISNQQLNVNQKKKKISQLIFSHKKKAKRKYHRPKDIHIDVEDNPNFDDDSIKENIGGIKEEFSL